MTSEPNETERFGFKRVTVANWLEPDPVWRYFVHPPAEDPATSWARDVLSPNLGEAVPLNVRKLFEVARGSLVYGWMFYPLLTIGTEQIFRVLDAAILEKCRIASTPAQVQTFSKRLEWLVKHSVLSSTQHKRWDAVRQMRNVSSHPHEQNIFDPNMSLDMLRMSIELINELFRSQEG